MINPIRDPLRGYRIACCILQSVEDVLAAHSIPWYVTYDSNGDYLDGRATVTAKNGGDWECLPGIYVWKGPSNAVFDGDKCTDEREHTFTIETGRCVNENIDLCRDPPTGCARDANGCPDIITPVLIEPCMDHEEKPTAAAEAAFLLAEREAIEYCLAHAVSCCIRDCLGLRCNGVELQNVTSATEGAAHFVTYEITVRY